MNTIIRFDKLQQCDSLRSQCYQKLLQFVQVFDNPVTIYLSGQVGPKMWIVRDIIKVRR